MMAKLCAFFSFSGSDSVVTVPVSSVSNDHITIQCALMDFESNRLNNLQQVGRVVGNAGTSFTSLSLQPGPSLDTVLQIILQMGRTLEASASSEQFVLQMQQQQSATTADIARVGGQLGQKTVVSNFSDEGFCTGELFFVHDIYSENLVGAYENKERAIRTEPKKIDSRLIVVRIGSLVAVFPRPPKQSIMPSSPSPGASISDSVRENGQLKPKQIPSQKRSIPLSLEVKPVCGPLRHLGAYLQFVEQLPRLIDNKAVS